jgi:hypothetical protein
VSQELVKVLQSVTDSSGVVKQPRCRNAICQVCVSKNGESLAACMDTKTFTNTRDTDMTWRFGILAA